MRKNTVAFSNEHIIDSTASYYLFNLIFDNLEKKYGESPDPIIEKRVRDEWVWMQFNNADFTIKLLYDTTRKLKKLGIPYSIRNLDNVSFILYLLDITNINPLRPHHNCHH